MSAQISNANPNTQIEPKKFNPNVILDKKLNIKSI
jgi:hypothetical protein